MDTALMKNDLKWFSPRSSTGSVLGAVAAHGIVYLLILGGLQVGFTKSEAPIGEVEIGYEVLDEPPAPVTEVRRMRTAEPVVKSEPVAKADPTARELQDEKSDVVGTTQSAPQPAFVGGTSGGDANATPYYKIKPKYPRAALISGDEGWVLLKIDVNPEGIVENVRVVGGEKRNLFESEARRAVEKWKYRPFLDSSGNPVKKADHQVRVDFKLSEQG